MHGADRISGNALSETQVFGTRAGKYASEYSRAKRQGELSSIEVREGIQKWKVFLHKKRGGLRPSALRRELKNLMDRYLGPNRTERQMKEALQKVLDLKQNGLPKIEVTGSRTFNMDWRMAMEVSMTFDLAELVVRSALMRKETRGHHLRRDFPGVSDPPKHTLVRKIGEEIEVIHSPVTKLG